MRLRTEHEENCRVASETEKTETDDRRVQSKGEPSEQRSTDKQLSSVNGAKTMLAKRHALAKPSVAESRFESKPKWNQGGRPTAYSWESWLCPMK